MSTDVRAVRARAAGRWAGEGYPWERQLGARPQADGQTSFRVWAPRACSLALRLAGADVELEHDGFGVYSVLADAVPGDDYWFVIDGVERPDPCSRSQPSGLRGPSRVLDTGAIRTAATQLPTHGARLTELVLYELHVGTFSREGTFDGAIPHLRGLADLGVTAIELMPVAEFPGTRGWGYDGVYISAAQSSYGGPEGLARLVRAAHDEGVAVVLDVVYNHLGASGVKAMEAFGPYFTQRYETPWGRAINFDDADCGPVREWVLQSAVSWIGDFGVDGLRLDAIHAIFDSSPEHIVAAIARRVHEVNDGALVIAESALNDPRVMRRREFGGYACDAAWADDFHHALRALLTADREGYYAEFGSVAALAKAFRRPFVHDGTYSPIRRRRFGAPAGDVPAERFVVFAQNHDQVGNRPYGDRLPAPARPLAAFCTLLAPFVPLLFMGEEYGEKAPFQFFSDHIDEKIATATREGRRREHAAFAQPDDSSAAGSGKGGRAGGRLEGEGIPDPQDGATFAASRLTRERDPELERLYVELLAARRRLPAGDADAIEFDEDARWLRVTRGRFELICSFATDKPVRVPCRAGAELQVVTDPGVGRRDRHVELPARSGALLG